MNPFAWVKYKLGPELLRRMLRSRRCMAFFRWRGGPVWILPNRKVIAGVADVREILARPSEFGMPYQAAMEELVTPFILGLNQSRAYRHQRGALDAALTPVDLGALEQATRGAARTLLDGAGCEIDLLAGLTDQVLARTIPAVLWNGPPLTRTQIDQARRIARHIFVNPLHDPSVRKAAVASAPHLRAAGRTMLSTRGVAPPDDVLQRLQAAATEPCGNPPADDILGLMVAWLTSVSRTVGFAFDELLRAERRQQLELAQIAARNGDGETLLAVLLEALRFRPPMPALDRVCTRTAHVNGHEIKRGTDLWVALTGADLDGHEYTHPRRFLPGGPDRDYLHFGGEYRHCPGEAISRCQLAAIGMEVLRRPELRRRGRLKLDGPYPSRLDVSYGPIPVATTLPPPPQPSPS